MGDKYGFAVNFVILKKQDLVDKDMAIVKEIAGKLGLPPDRCAYMGDDDIDAPALRWAGMGVTVPGAMPAALAAARCVTTRGGGRGAVREICDRLLAARGLAKDGSGPL